MTLPDFTALSALPTERQRCLARTLGLLEKSFGDAHRGGYDLWQFALSIDEMRASGADSADLRWLLSQGFIEQALEDCQRDAAERTFHPITTLRLSAASCFILAAGAVQGVQQWQASILLAAEPGAAPLADPGEPVVPHWNEERRELTFRGLLIKRFQVSAPSQDAILFAFQKKGWLRRIADPLPRLCGKDRSQRLPDGVNGLNRSHVNLVIEFHRDGSGAGVCWRQRQQAWQRTG